MVHPVLKGISTFLKHFPTQCYVIREYKSTINVLIVYDVTLEDFCLSNS